MELQQDNIFDWIAYFINNIWLILGNMTISTNIDKHISSTIAK